MTTAEINRILRAANARRITLARLRCAFDRRVEQLHAIRAGQTSEFPRRAGASACEADRLLLYAAMEAATLIERLEPEALRPAGWELN